LVSHHSSHKAPPRDARDAIGHRDALMFNADGSVFIFQHASVGGREGVELAARTGGRLQLTLHLYPLKGQVLVTVEKIP